jgi:hypothetical protein
VGLLGVWRNKNANPLAPIEEKIKKLSGLESFFIATESGKMETKNTQTFRFK